ncbi:MAG TPA: Ppx/GppA phosphatase family protein [Gemmatimonadales bacterium]|nr:Ppx/GppA phosphatase family protein [Gemmatimonadales bacterium]
MSSGGERLAAIDVGSNTILLTVAEPALDGLTIIEEAEDQPRLGAGVGASGRLQDDAIDRAIRSLIRIRDTCRQLGVHRIAAVATAAVRDAANGAEFVRRVRELDIPLRVISPEAEAALAYRSAAYRFGPEPRMLVADIGGGSLELVGAAEGTVRVARSLPLGAVRLTELGMSQVILRRHIQESLAASISEDDWREARVIGSGGTFATLAGMARAQRGEKRERIHGTSIPTHEVEQLLGMLAAMSLEDRRKVPGLPVERADIIVAGLAVVAELLATLRTGAVTVSGYGLRDGLLLEMSGLES